MLCEGTLLWLYFLWLTLPLTRCVLSEGTFCVFDKQADVDGTLTLTLALTLALALTQTLALTLTWLARRH